MMNQFLLYIYIFIFAAVFGSFLNVVIYRLPIMLKNQWRTECLEFLGQNALAQTTKFNLVTPNSQCPLCHTAIKWWVNIPVIGYLLLRGRCASCSGKISFRYPLIEITAGLLACFLVFHYGFTLIALCAIVFSFFLLVGIFIDIDHMLLPDQITLTLLWLGLLINSQAFFVSPIEAIIGATAGYLFLWLVMQSYKLISGKVGMGHGDFKLLAAIGAWLGWQALPATIFIAAFMGSIVGITLLLLHKSERQTPLPFGPYLAVAGWIVMIWGDQIARGYLTFIG